MYTNLDISIVIPSYNNLDYLKCVYKSVREISKDIELILYDDKFDQVQNIQWVFDSSPSLDDIEMEIKAYIELYGIAPELIVIDNLMNVAAESDNEWAGLRQIMVELHDMARKTEACVMVLHHVSEQSEYFTDRTDKTIFKEITSFVDTYNSTPSIESLVLSIKENRNLTDTELESCESYLKEIENGKKEETKIEWLVDKTEQFCQERSYCHHKLYQAR